MDNDCFLMMVGNTQYYVQESPEKPGHYRYLVHRFVKTSSPFVLDKVGTFVYEIREGRHKLMEALHNLDKHLHVPDPYGVLGKIKQFCQSEAYQYHMVEEFAEEIIDLCNGDRH